MKSSPAKNQPPILAWCDTLAILAWGILLLKYWFTGQLRLLIHPNYFWLVLVSGIVLVLMGLAKLKETLQTESGSETKEVEHITLFAPGLSTGLLLITAIVAFIIPPGVLGSQMALSRGVADSLPATRLESQAFRTSVNPEERTIIDWVRTINTYPEPDSYVGQKADVVGFVVHDDNLGEDYIFISRFVLTCCAVDAYPVGIPVKIDQSRSQYPPDTWLQVKGKMIAQEVGGKRQVVIDPDSLEKVPTPKDPYAY